MRSTLVTALSAVAILVIGCDSLNESIPPISISGGIFGLNGTAGKELSGDFHFASKTDALAATALFTLTDTFDDADAGDFAEVEELITHLGVALYTGDVGMKLVNTGLGSYPVHITATAWNLDFSISDVNHSGGAALGPPWPLNSGAHVTFSRSPACAPGSPECTYTVSSGDIETLMDLFPIEVASDDGPFLDDLSDIVFMDGGSNTVNTLFLQLRVHVTNPLDDFTDLEARIRVGEFETQIRPAIF